MAKANEEKPAGTEEVEEQFIAVETDDEGRPINQQVADADVDTDEDAEEDERAGHAEGEQHYRGPANESIEDKRARRKRERKAQHIRQRVAAQAKDRTINTQVEQIHQLVQRVAKLEGRSTSVDQNLIQNQLNTVEQQQRDAKSTLAALAKAEDWAGVAEVTDIQHQLRDQHRHLKMALHQAQNPSQGEARTTQERSEREPPARQQIQAPSPVTVAHAETWAEEHNWYNPKRNPEDTAIVTAIDSVIAREGFDPETPEYWEELTRRVQKRLPHRFNKGTNAQVDTPAPAPVKGGPKMTPASQNGGNTHRTLRPNEVYISPARKAAMQEAGIWDDPKRRAKMLKTYAEYDKQNA